MEDSPAARGRTAAYADCPVDDIVIKLADDAHRATGLLAFCSFTLFGSIVIHGASIRRTRDGRTVLQYPRRSSKQHREHSCVYPKNERIAKVIELQVFERLRCMLDGLRIAR